MPTAFDPIPLLYSDPVSYAVIEIVAGADWNDAAQLVEPVEVAGVPTDSAINLTSTHQRIEIRPAYDHATLIAAADTRTNEIIVENAATGLIQIFVPGGTTATWPRGRWTFTWTLLKAGEIKPVLRGPFVIR